MTDLDLYWHEQPEPLYRTTDDNDLADTMERAVAYADEMEDEAGALRGYRMSARITEALDRLARWHQIGDEDKGGGGSMKTARRC